MAGGNVIEVHTQLEWDRVHESNAGKAVSVAWWVWGGVVWAAGAGGAQHPG